MTATVSHSSGRRPTLVSVIVAAYNQERLVGELLSALARQSWQGESEVLFMDNGSADGTLEVAKSFQGRVRGLTAIRADRKRGQCAARNDGVALAAGDLLLFVDGDDIPSVDWIERMTDASAHADLVGGRLVVTEINSPSTVKRWPGSGAECLAALPFCHLPYATGTNLGVWRDVLDAVGGWNEDYLGGGEDAELCWRAQLRGYSLGAAPGAVVHYRLRSGVRALLRQNFGYGKATVRLRRDFVAVTSGGSAHAVAKSTKTALGALGACRDSDARVRYMARAAYRVGQFAGALDSSIRRRVPVRQALAD